MNSFKVGDKIEALDEFGMWAKASIAAIQEDNFCVSFDGFASMWDMTLTEENIRPETIIELPKKRSRESKILEDLRRLQSGDIVFIVNGGEVTVVQVDPIRGRLIVELKDGENKEVDNNELCSPPPTCISTKAKAGKKHKKRKTEVLPKENKEVPATQVDDEEQHNEHYSLIYFLREDGMWLRVGDIVSVEGVELPFIISRMFFVDGCVTVKLVNIHNSGLRENFVINCSVNFVVGYVGEKVGLKGSIKEKLEQDALIEFCNSMSCRVGGSVEVNMRKMVLGHAMRVGLQGGFGNLGCIRVSLGPSDILIDNKIFNFLSMTGVRKFALVGDGEFEFLDTILGKEWDYKMGRGEDSFFKFITEIQVKRSRDLCLSLVAKFSQSQFIFGSLYREECRRVVKEGREQMENIIL